MKKFTPSINRKALNKLEILQLKGEPNIILEIIDLLLDSAPFKIKQLKENLDQKNFKQAEHEAHGLRSSLKTLGADHLSSLCQEFEVIEKSKNLNQAYQLIESIETEYAQVVVELIRIKTQTRMSA